MPIWLRTACRKLATTGNVTADELDDLKDSLDRAFDLDELERVLFPFAGEHVHKLVEQHEDGAISLNKTAIKSALGSAGVALPELSPEEADGGGGGGRSSHSSSQQGEGHAAHDHEEEEAPGADEAPAAMGRRRMMQQRQQAQGRAAPPPQRPRQLNLQGKPLTIQCVIHLMSHSMDWDDKRG
jgi:hypothetical protein